MPTLGERVRSVFFWLGLFGMPAMSIAIIAWPPLLVPGILIYGGVMIWLRPRSD